jgi:hypothetical protein
MGKSTATPAPDNEPHDNLRWAGWGSYFEEGNTMPLNAVPEEFPPLPEPKKAESITQEPSVFLRVVSFDGLGSSGWFVKRDGTRAYPDRTGIDFPIFILEERQSGKIELLPSSYYVVVNNNTGVVVLPECKCLTLLDAIPICELANLSGSAVVAEWYIKEFFRVRETDCESWVRFASGIFSSMNLCSPDKNYKTLNDLAKDVQAIVTESKKEGCLKKVESKETVNHPQHYGGADNLYEAIKVIEAWRLSFNLGNVVKYVSRAGKKCGYIEDLEKARFYLNREIENAKKEVNNDAT